MTIDKPDVEYIDLAPSSTALFPRSFEKYPEVVRGEGAYLYDRQGNEYFDAIAGNQCSNIGHGVEEIADAAAKQMRKLEYASSMMFVNDQSQEFAEKMTEFLPPGFEHVWMVSGGSEANESALKFVRQYHRLKGNSEKHIVIGRERSFHGNTLGTLGVGGLPARREPYVPMLNQWPKAPAAYPFRCPHCSDEQECRTRGESCAKRLEDVIRNVGPKYVAGFIAEPIVGAANAAVVPGEEYFSTIRDICDSYDVLLIVDEVMTGMGRTGENFAIQHWDVTPDVITCAKGMSAGYTPLGGMMPHTNLVDVFADHKSGFTHGHTYSFNPVTSAIASAVLDYMEARSVVSNARAVGKYASEQLEDLYEFEMVGDVRGKGLMKGIEFVENRQTKASLKNGGPAFRSRLFEKALENGLTVYPGGGSVDGENGDHVLLTPPLTINRSQVDEMVRKLRATLNQVLRDQS